MFLLFMLKSTLSCSVIFFFFLLHFDTFLLPYFYFQECTWQTVHLTRLLRSQTLCMFAAQDLLVPRLPWNWNLFLLLSHIILRFEYVWVGNFTAHSWTAPSSVSGLLVIVGEQVQVVVAYMLFCCYLTFGILLGKKSICSVNSLDLERQIPVRILCFACNLVALIFTQAADTQVISDYVQYFFHQYT
jgi:hypothetical protein